MEFVSFPSIEGFHNVVKESKYYKPKLNYRGKIKLHGTNAGVRVMKNEIAAQSRSQIITPTNDNVGFAKWVEDNKTYFLNLSHSSQLDNFTIFGEWCGPGIMKGTAINKIPNKIFAVFAIMLGSGDEATVIISPEKIEAILAFRPTDIHVLPWCCEPFAVDFSEYNTLQGIADALNQYVSEIEHSDPWVKTTFGIEGTAEGAVYYPSDGADIKRSIFSDFTFKAKGEKHKVVKTKESVQIDPEVVAGAKEFVTAFVTEARLEQGLAAIGGVADMKKTGDFLKWIGQDIKKESVDELIASGLTWDQVQKEVTTAARTWFRDKSMVIA
jgi:hypothetical protein